MLPFAVGQFAFFGVVRSAFLAFAVALALLLWAGAILTNHKLSLNAERLKTLAADTSKLVCIYTHVTYAYKPNSRIRKVPTEANEC
jgi:hypothetical protein